MRTLNPKDTLDLNDQLQEAVELANLIDVVARRVLDEPRAERDRHADSLLQIACDLSLQVAERAECLKERRA